MVSSATRDDVVRAPDGVDLFVREWGDPDGPEILFVHGLAQCHLSFAKQTSSFLADGHRIVAFDLRGHGASAKPPAPEFYQDGRRWADDINAVMAAKRLHRPVLVGWSLGGRVVRQYLMHYGDRQLSGINFLATRPIEHASVVGPGSKAAAESDKTDLGNRLRAEIAFLKDCYATLPPADELALQIAFNALLPATVRAAIGDWKTDPAAILEALGRVTVPTLISHGRLDRLILPRAAEMTAEAVKSARISWYEDCGHSPFYEAADRYNRELAEFVAGAWQVPP
jgi:pimeloyl-ACP methyl ester carboxylesterase